jgi:FlaA1/EpsC-like NDP-sugar epimerase
LPGKIKLDSEFIQKPGIANYFKFLLLGITKTISGVIGNRQIQSNQPQLYLLIVDLFLITGAYLFAYNFFVWQANGVLEIIHSTRYLPIVIVVRLLCNQYFGLYRPLLKYLSNYDIFETVKANSFGTGFLFLIAFLLERQSYSLRIASLDWLVLNLSSAGLRLALMMYFQHKNQRNKGSTKSRVLIYGACDEGNHACRLLISDNMNEYEVVGFIDDAAHNYGKTLNKKKVLGNRYTIKDLVKLYNIDQVVIADRHRSEKDLLEIIGLCAENKLKCGIFSNTNGISSNHMNTSIIRDIEITDILSPAKIYFEAGKVKNFISGKTILINGSGGVMGIELCKSLINLGCKKLIVIERYESYLNEFCFSILKEDLCTLIVPVLLESEKNELLDTIFLEHRPNIVIQAGLRKFESICGIQANNIENINYTKNYHLAKLTAKYKCEKFVMISTCYAKKPKNLIDDSLQEAEKFLEDFFLFTNTRLIIVPMCDIAESQGGIVSIIETQVKRRETVNIPIQYDRTLVVSKEQAAKIIFQYMVEEKKELIEQKIFCDNNSPVFLTDIVQKLAALYGLKLLNKNPLIKRNFSI